MEGIALGSLLGVLTTWLMYSNSAAFARRAAPIRPAPAVRVTE
nr:hypothetical protein [Streptomyces wedmorensis]